MKSQYSRILAILGLFLFVTSGIKADSLKIDNFTINGGESKTVTISVDATNSEMFEYIGFQFDMFLPEGISLVSAQPDLSLPDFTLQQRNYGGGTYKFMGYSATATPATSPNILSITLKAEEIAPSGDAVIKLQNVVFSGVKGEDIEIANSTSTANVYISTTGLSLNYQNLNMMVGQTSQLTATVSPSNATETTVTWNSQSPEVASVGSNGEVTALSQGTATITATCGTVSATCKVTVNPVPAESIEMELQNVTLYVGGKTKLAVKVLPPNTTNPVITWTSSDTKTVTVESDGTVTALAVGTATITATCGTAKATCRVTVNPVPSQGIAVNPESATLTVGATLTVTATVMPENTTDKNVEWTSSNPAVAKVSSTGVITAIAPGKATITAKNGNNTGTCEVTVTPVVSTSLTLNEEALTLLVGATSTLTATVSPANTTDKTLTWSSNNEGVATVSATGVVTAIAPGTATITVRNGNNTASCKVTVNPVPSTSVTLNVEDITMKVGATTTLTATVSPANTTDKTLTWSSDNEGVATVSATGVVTAIAPGTATIKVSNGNASATCKVTVLAETATSISLNIEDQTIYVAATTQLIATVSPDNITDKTITWSSDTPGVATVDANGLVTGVSAGTATITATCGPVSATCVITVIARETAPISVTTSDLNVRTTDGQQVLMWVSTEGGNPDGWSFSWTYAGEEVSTEKNLEITARNQNDIPVTETYSVNVRNVNDGTLAYNETFTFTIEIWPLVVMPFEEGADDESLLGNNDGTTQDEEGWWERNGIHVETLKTREGNSVGMWTETPQGGYNNDWEYLWTISGEEIGEGESIDYIAAMADGESMEIDAQTPLITMTNYGPDGDVWYRASAYGPTVEVYRRPRTPLQLLREDDGTSQIFVVIMPLSDSQITEYNYKFAFGYTDAEGNDKLIDVTPNRYTHAEEDVCSNPDYRFWAYSLWQYPNGTVISSGLRYLDGSVDEDFSASVSNGAGLSNLTSQGKTRTAIYTLDGQYLGSKSDRLAPGIYILHTVENGVSKAEKFVVR